MIRMRRHQLIVLAAGGLLWPSVLLATTIVPASLQDIVEAMGVDARGLNLRQDSLPDFFTLTASPLDEDSTKLTTEQPQSSCRWNGGKAVIEYARDLSYTLVSVYDKEGHRERIYSVKNNASRRPASEATRSLPSPQTVPVETPRHSKSSRTQV